MVSGMEKNFPLSLIFNFQNGEMSNVKNKRRESNMNMTENPTNQKRKRRIHD